MPAWYTEREFVWQGLMERRNSPATGRCTRAFGCALVQLHKAVDYWSYSFAKSYPQSSRFVVFHCWLIIAATHRSCAPWRHILEQLLAEETL